MSPQDSQLLQDFLSQLVQARGVAKDPEAEAMISRAVAEQPDAAYLLVQRALLMQQALNNARAEIAALQNQLRAQPQAAPAFFDPNSWGNSGTARPSASQPVAPPPSQPQYQQPHPGSFQAQQAPTQGGFLSGRAGGMLGNIAATAAGVAGGAFLFQGLEHLLGNHAGNGFLGPQSALNRPAEETTIVNNYYDDPDRGSTRHLADTQDSDNLLGSPDTSTNDFDQLADDLGPDDDLFS